MKREIVRDRRVHDATADARAEFDRLVREARRRYEATMTYPPTPSELTLYARQITEAREDLYAAIAEVRRALREQESP